MKAAIAKVSAALALILVLAIAGFYISIFAAAAHNRSIASKPGAGCPTHGSPLAMGGLATNLTTPTNSLHPT